MITEDYCSFEVAKLLKEKGFDWECEHVIWEGADDNYENYDKAIPNPTLQMAMKWLREVHGTFIAINNDDLDFNWQCYDLINRDSTLDPKILSDSYAGYKTYEEAVEAACIYALKNLI